MRAWTRRSRGATSLLIAIAAAAFAGGTALGAPSTWLELDGNVLTDDVVTAGVHDWANSGTGAPNACPGSPGAVSLDGEHRAALDGFAVEFDGTSPA